MNSEIKGIKRTCIVCEKQKEKGFYLYSSFICLECEQEIVETETNEPNYQFFVKQLSQLTTRQNIFN